MPTPRRVASAIMFFPRGGSAHVARAFAERLPGENWSTTLIAGSCSGGGRSDAERFYRGVGELEAVDFTPALGSAHPLDPPAGAAPMHPSYEDRDGAADRVFAELGEEAFERQVRAWSNALHRAEAAGADVLHLHHLTPIDEAAIRAAPQVPVVSHLHGTELLMLEQIDAGPPAAWTHAEQWAERMRGWAARASRVVVATPHGAQRAAALLPIEADRIEVVANGFDAARFSPGTVDRGEIWSRVLLGDPQGWRPGEQPGSWRASEADVAKLARGTVLLYVGRFTAVKRTQLLIEAFERARVRLGDDVSLVLVGGHPGEWEGEHPADTIDRIGARGVLLAGWHDQDALPELLRASDAVVLPSVNESFGQVLVEGMACGLPAIAVDHGGPAEIVTDGETGWLVDGDDGPALERAICEAAQDGAERARRGRLAREDVLGRYTWTALTRRLADVLGAAADEAGGADPLRGPSDAGDLSLT